MSNIYDSENSFNGEFGDVRGAVGLDTNPGSTTPPPNASAAPSSNPEYTGLCEALNKYQQDLAKSNQYQYADRYVIKFMPTELAQTPIEKQGSTSYSDTTMTAPNTAANRVDSDKQRVNTKSRSVQITAGTQIIQAINQIVSTSTYITGQAKMLYDEQQQTMIENSNSAKNPTWFKVSFQSVPIAYDDKRKDYAYEMTYLITPYAINQLVSEYFNDPRFRGVHKVYNYWFTGQNDSVLDFTAEYDALYTVTMSGNLLSNRKSRSTLPTSETDSSKKAAKSASSQSSQGAKNKTNEPSSNAMEYLFSPGDQNTVTIKIVGDPAWIQQGEVVSLQGFNFDPFLADGTINSDTAEVVFALNFNQPADYDMETGLVDVLGRSRKMMGSYAASVPQESAAYRAQSVTHTFNRGKFEQEITGIRLTNLNDQALQNYYPSPDAIRQQNDRNPLVRYIDSREPNTQQQNVIPSTNNSPLPALPSGTDNDSNPPALPANPQTPATSNGDISRSLTPGESVVQPGVNNPSQTNQNIAKEA